MIYTSYFSKWRGYNNPDYVLMATTYYKPGWFKGEWFSEVAPKEELVKSYKEGKTSSDRYIEIYWKYLEDNEDIILSKIKGFDPNKTYILLCFEGPGKFCHRHVLASWLCSKGYECEEY